MTAATGTDVASILRFLGDDILKFTGDEKLVISGPAALSNLRPNVVTFFKSDLAPVAPAHGWASPFFVVCGFPTFESFGEIEGCSAVAVEKPRLQFIRILQHFFALPKPFAGASATAQISNSAEIHPTASIGPNTVIGENVVVGARTVLHAGVVLYDNVRLGSDVVVHANTSIGAPGFGYERTAGGDLECFPQLGGVDIRDEVEIGSSVSIDRGALNDTIIERGAKIDNQVHIAHNVVIGAHTLVIAQSMIGGSVIVGPRCWIAPGSNIKNGINIGADATVGLGAVVVKNVADGDTVVGNPAETLEKFVANREAIKKLLSDR